MVLGVPLLDDLTDSKFLWACPNGNSKTCNSKRWKLPSEPCAESISTLNEWCQAMSTHLTLTWDFSFSHAEVDLCAPAEYARKHVSSTNYKGLLNNLLHKLLCRPVVSGDVVYVLEPRSTTGSFTATVTIWIDRRGSEPRKFAGMACSSKKAAEQSAAAKALEALEGPSKVPKPPEKLRMRKMQLQSCNYKGLLVQQLQQLLGQTMTQDDVIFNTPAESPPFVTSLEVTVMKEKKIVVSAACPNKKAAEQNAARAMVEQLQKDFVDLKTTSAACGPMISAFCCKVSVMLGDDILCEASSQTSFSKQSAKESAAFLACEKLSEELKGVEGQLQMAEQIKRFCVSQMPGLTEMEMERLRPKSSKVPVASQVIMAEPHQKPLPVGFCGIRDVNQTGPG